MKGGLLTYRPRLDGLRFIAIALVLVEHFGSYLANFIAAGYYGVDFFFVISGFLITSILIKDNRPSISASYRTFMGRRVLRIFPAYYLTIAVLAIVNLEPTRELLPWLLTYTFNYGAALYRDAGNENPLYYLWSLSVEEQFYLVWPLLVLGLKRMPGRLIALTAVIVVASYAQITFDLVAALNPFNYTGLPNRMGSLGLGALGAMWVAWRSLPERFLRSVWTEGAAVIAIAVALTVAFPFRFVVMGLCSLFFVLKASQYEFRLPGVDAFLQHRWITYVGVISYGIYLFHIPVGVALTAYVFDPVWTRIPFDALGPFSVLRWHSWLIKLPLYSAVSIAVATLSYRWLERPLLTLKDRWFSYRNAPVATGGAVSNADQTHV